jgi:NADP-reducing hydrogenase subunit HndB
MARLTIDDLKQMRERAAPLLALRTGTARAKITVHMGTCGIAAGARDVMAALLTAIEQEQISDVIVTTAGCAGLCRREPMATVEIRNSAPVKYVDLTPDTILTVLRQHVLGGAIVVDAALAAGCETTG